MRKKCSKNCSSYAGRSDGSYTCGGGQSTWKMVGGNTSAGGNAGSGSSTQAEESDKNAIKDLVTYEAPNREQGRIFLF